MRSPKNTENLQVVPSGSRPLDGFDRKILGALVANADVSYAELGQIVGLSAPAVHDRVKKLRASGRMRCTAALLDGPAIGKPLLAFVHVDTTGWGKTQGLMSMAELPEVEEIHSVAGDTSIMVKVRCASSRALEGLLARLYAIPGVKSTRSFIVLSTYLERTIQADVTASLEAEQVQSS
jgi:DNA-binding Lrp family transcriptional regulator